MKQFNLVITIVCITMLASFKPASKTDPFTDYPAYSGNDLGVNYSPQQTVFKVWAPKAGEVKLRLYDAGNGGELPPPTSMTKGPNGTWELIIKKDLKNKYYTFQVLQDGKWLLECPDIYARAVGVNGARGMVADLASTNPKTGRTTKSRCKKTLRTLCCTKRTCGIFPSTHIQA